MHFNVTVAFTSGLTTGLQSSDFLTEFRTHPRNEKSYKLLIGNFNLGLIGKIILKRTASKWGDNV